MINIKTNNDLELRRVGCKKKKQRRDSEEWDPKVGCDLFCAAVDFMKAGEGVSVCLCFFCLVVCPVLFLPDARPVTSVSPTKIGQSAGPANV